MRRGITFIGSAVLVAMAAMTFGAGPAQAAGGTFGFITPSGVGIPAFNLSVTDDDPTTPDVSVSRTGVEDLALTLQYSVSDNSTPQVLRGEAKACDPKARINALIKAVAKVGESLSGTLGWNEVDAAGHKNPGSMTFLSHAEGDVSRGYEISICVR